MFDRRHIASVSIYGIHQLSILHCLVRMVISRENGYLSLDVVESQVILALVKFASANISLIYGLAIQPDLFSFYPVKIGDRLFNGRCILILAVSQVLSGTSSIVDRSIG